MKQAGQLKRSLGWQEFLGQERMERRAFPLGGPFAVDPNVGHDFDAFANEVVYHAAPDLAQQARIVEDELRSALGYGEKFNELCRRVEKIENLLETVLKRLDQLGSPAQNMWVPIESLAPEPYEVLRPLTAVVTPSADGFESSFFDANIHAYGDTEEEAVANLKSSILDAYDRLSELDESDLGPGPTKQKRIIETHIRKVQI